MLIHVGFLLGHHLLTEVYLPSGDVLLGILEKVLHDGDGLIRGVIHQLLACYLAIEDVLIAGIHKHGTKDVAVGIFHEYLALEAVVPDDAP